MTLMTRQLNNFLNHAIGFEDVFNRLSSLHTYNTGFPYYNIKKNTCTGYSLKDFNTDSIPSYFDISANSFLLGLSFVTHLIFFLSRTILFLF